MITNVDALFNPPPAFAFPEFPSAGRVPHNGDGARPSPGPRSKASKFAVPEWEFEPKTKAPGPRTDGLTQYERYEIGRARKENALADKHELGAGVLSDKLIFRDMVRLQSARALATCSQSLDTIPDYLESRFGIDIEMVEAIRGVIDEVKQGLAEKLQAIHEENRHAVEVRVSKNLTHLGTMPIVNNTPGIVPE